MKYARKIRIALPALLLGSKMLSMSAWVAAITIPLAWTAPLRANEVDLSGGKVKVGVLHSLSGTMAISETSLRDMVLFAFDEINKNGGVLGKQIDPVVVDGASNWPLFAEKAKQLLQQDKVAVVFGCWTSVSRKSVLPVFEQDDGMLFYPVQYEGEELSKNIFYTAEAVNQQATPAVDYLLAQGKKKFYLVGSDYVYPQTTNLILFKYLQTKGVPVENIGGGLREDSSGKVISAGKYVPFGYTDFQQIVSEIKQFAAGGDACVINTINGDSNVPFFKEIASVGLSPAECPIVSFSLAEDELRSLPTKDLVGELGCWTYFMSLKTPENRDFLERWSAWLKTQSYPGVVKEKRAVDSPMVLSYDGVYLWKKAVEKAGTFDVDKVRGVLENDAISFDGPGGKITMQTNHHATKNVYIGETTANGQFKILSTFPQVKAEPFLLKSLDEQLEGEPRGGNPPGVPALSGRGRRAVGRVEWDGRLARLLSGWRLARLFHRASDGRDAHPTLIAKPDRLAKRSCSRNLSGSFSVDWNVVMAGAVIVAGPTALIDILLGRFFVRGLLAGSVKG